ncbi:MAG: hypothetical protein DWQ07_10035 [Chloroflexi bacterium]|nr:MAG: hypothetical protein DWQ07_10035 [Chloroflexota bacterium]MBL1192950.1 hypothetical protein [Chloroflexota bacterium]NOH10242.1 Ig-like domain-containing protein [Chloroflexota bacterium]
MKRKLLRSLIASIILLLLLPSTALGLQDDPALTLRLNRDFGYGGLDNSIQGRFSMRVNDIDLTRVDFYIDDQLIGSDDEAPFRIQFETDDYPPGLRTMYAIGITSGGTELRSNEITSNFLSADEARSATLGLIVPLLVVVFGLMGLGVLVPLLLNRGDKSRPIGEYGMAGGAVCPRCTLPYSRHTLAPNLLVGKLERCPHCGKWAIVPRAAPADLVVAEARLRADNQEGVLELDETEEEKLQRQLEESKYEE